MRRAALTCIGGAGPVWNIAPPRAAAIIGEGPGGPVPYGPAREGRSACAASEMRCHEASAGRYKPTLDAAQLTA
jgi:hypothetical protein